MQTVTRRDVLKFGIAGAGALVVSGLGFDVAVAESTKIKLNLRIAGAKESHSICPYCAVGCSLVAYTRQNSDGSTQLLQIEGDPHGVVRFELQPDGDATILTLVARTPVPDEAMRLRVSAGWHVHLDFLEDFLDDGTRVDWPHWPRDRWEALYERINSRVSKYEAAGYQIYGLGVIARTA